MGNETAIQRIVVSCKTRITPSEAFARDWPGIVDAVLDAAREMRGG